MQNPQETACSVSDAIERATLALETLDQFWIEGEIFGYRGPYQGSGHYYFKLRDESSQLEVKLWSRAAPRALQCELEEGRKVRALGKFDIYSKNGSLSFILSRVEDVGAGNLARQFEEMRRRLQAEGLFDDAKKKELPDRPQKVVVITAHPSAASADFLRTLAESGAPLKILMRPARVQGAGAQEEIAEAIHEAVRAKPDLIVLTRGGGSLEDLWAFNEEVLVRAVAHSPIPILNAVGHESDTTLCDYAADERAKTPTAAAHRIATGWTESRREVARLGDGLLHALESQFQRRRQDLALLWRDLREHSPSRRAERMRFGLEQASSDLARAMEQPFRRLKESLHLAEHRLHAASPEALLNRGWALVQAEGVDGFLRDPSLVAAGDSLKIRLAKGELPAQVADPPSS
ncbi:MAG TPA: exodeoxyribonuclease VII large subunit [Planctomycetota bacterium]|jgi:exodeoxyribonuclease VII large subunit|nr:exodeoxyribonuclease VII large subunit [Planctomycetota bacterium]HJM39571.1 exodeoxyribonuclease VII large subunit [Planctomycetota bacterium]|tara:strand:+ start:46350 stop:47564 length:1215 start_codon:yes stop_codon:yes gene_type:complete